MQVYKKPLDFVLVKPAGPDCNLGCKYCFYLEKSALFPSQRKHRMSEQTLEILIKQVATQSGDSVAIAWQGGEPTLMGLEFYQKAVALEQQYGKGKIWGNALQTNGTLLNKDWAVFLAEYQFLVGLSLDGPRHIHDYYRLTDKGKPSWERVVHSYDLLSSCGVAMNAMCCVTDYSANYAEELYEYYKSLGLEWMQFIPVVETDKNDPTKAASFSLSAKKYATFLKRIFELWVNDFSQGEPTTHIRNFESLFYTYVGLPSPECTLLPECGAYPTVEHNGNVYSCDFFVEHKWKLGNIHKNKLVEMLNSNRQTEFGKMKGVLPAKCHHCKWYKHCFGGCTKDRIKDPKDAGMPRFCNTTIEFLEYADPFFRDLAKKWQHQRQLEAKYAQTYDASEHFTQDF